MPTAWDLLLRETRAGLRRYAGTPYGDRYQSVVAHAGTGDHTSPQTAARTLGDLTDPYRAERFTDAVNAVTRDVSMDVSEWSVVRILSAVELLQAEQERRESELSDPS